MPGMKMRPQATEKHGLALAIALAALALLSCPAPAGAGKSGPVLRTRARPAHGGSASASGLSLTLAIRADESNTGPMPNVIRINRSSTRYVIDSNGLLPPPLVNGLPFAGCSNPAGNENRLLCLITAIRGFEIVTRGGNDTVTATKSVAAPTLMKGGSGLDDLYGGSSSDKLVGGTEADKLVGRSGPDALYGGPGPDRLLGGSGKDVLRGGPGRDVLRGGPGRDDPKQ
jgi:RTX calcium-binding nonapeptide repeat (4 copies)